jgi:hypoxanthine phosphoribosyltransferase
MDIIYSWLSFEKDCAKILRFLPKREIKNIFGIPRGGLILAVRLSHLLSKADHKVLLISRDEEIEPGTLIVDDISDSGKTLLEYSSQHRTNLFITLWICDQTKFTPSLFLRMKKKDDWVVFPWERKIVL